MFDQAQEHSHLDASHSNPSDGAGLETSQNVSSDSPMAKTSDEINDESPRENSTPAEPAEIGLDDLTPEQYQALRSEYVRKGKGTPPAGGPPV